MSEVKQWQIWLNNRMPSNQPLEVDGVFGPESQARTKRWQRFANLPQTGLPDSATINYAKSLGFLWQPAISPEEDGDIVRRAKLALHHKTIYKLGAGGRNPSAPFPWDEDHECDCTGFLAHCWGMHRDLSVNRKVHIQSDYLVLESRKPASQSAVVKLKFPEIGCGIVYPGKWTGGKLLWGNRISAGHAAVYIGKSEIIDCASGSYRRTGDAITKRNGLWMIKHPDVVFVRMK